MTTTPTTDSIATLELEARAGLAAAADEGALEAWRVDVLGRGGSLTGVLRSLAGLEPEARRAVGAAANRLRDELEAALAARREELGARALAAQVAAGALDVTLPGRPLRRGGLHPVTQTLRAILDAFTRMGFDTIEGPEVELDEYNFERLRIPADHPARDMWDTFWLSPQLLNGAAPDRAEGSVAAPDRAASLDDRADAQALLLRTHTSPMQVRYMEQHQPPIRIAVPGRCYRYEATDATHEWMLTQVELLVVDEGVSMADLKGTLQEFARQLFGPQTRVLLRNSYFPFVEPGVELAVSCFACPGDNPACAVCRGSGWLEVMGAGMVHPEILAAAGYDPERVTGFAAGMGVERIAMLRHSIDDIRNFYANDLRFLRQF
ncbi:MAG: phenylalanine--tRNA ligase subunit alpha [Dehalococcoidia bacterium]|nr:phenylalanine--tRNA ligase subunit alpha [Dehalococcoidia bacterium]